MSSAPNPGQAPGASDGDQLRATRIMLRPIASPFGLGFAGLAGASASVAGLELGWIPSAQAIQVGIIVLVFAPVLQLVACVFGFLGRDPLAATGMGVLAVTWACIGLSIITAPPGAIAALGTVLFLGCAVIGVTALTAARAKVVPAIVMAMTALRFAVTGVYDFVPDTAWKTASGIVGLVTAAVAVYAVAALELEGVRHAPLLPTLRRGKGRQALRADLATQVSDVAAEPGVRQQL